MRAPTSRAARSCCGARHAHRLARDRHAGGLRHRRGRGGAQAARSRCSRPATNWWRRANRFGPAAVYDSNGAIIAAAVTEAGGEPVSFGAFPDDEAALELPCARRSPSATWCVLSGGTSKGAGDLSHRVVAKLGKPGILVHGVALKPGKPLCLAVVDGKPIAVLPGFPTSAIFTFHAFVAPRDPRPRRSCRRRRRGTHRGRRCRCALPPSWAARNSCWSRWSRARRARSRFRPRRARARSRASRKPTAFIEIDALAPALDAGARRAGHADRAKRPRRPIS